VRSVASKAASAVLSQRGYSELLVAVLDGNVEALTTLGTLLTYRVGIQDLGEVAYACHLAGAGAGDVSAQFNLGSALIEGAGTAKNVKRGVGWLRTAKRKGSDDATNYLGHCYRNGVGVRKDARRGFRLSLEAANKGLANAQYAVGVCLLRGLGVARDDTSGWRWLRLAAANQDRAAMEFIKEFNAKRRSARSHGQPLDT
jgi:TPR repeat protein